MSAMPSRRGIRPWARSALGFAAAVLTLVSLGRSAAPASCAQLGACEEWAWFVYHSCETPGAWCDLQLTRTYTAKMDPDVHTVFGSYPTEGAALAATCGSWDNPRLPSGSVYPGVKADIGGEVYDVGPFVQFEKDGRIVCREPQPDNDHDGVPESPIPGRLGSDFCLGSPVGTPVDITGCPCEETDECSAYCQTLGEHEISDGTSKTLDNCSCICEKGWGRPERNPLVCTTCDEICRQEDKYSRYDKTNKAANECPCECVDGYDDRYTEQCTLVECPANAANMAKLQKPDAPYIVTCRKDYVLNRHCCCKSGYVPRGGICIKRDEVPKPGYDWYEGLLEPDLTRCKDYGIAPSQFDLIFDDVLLNMHFVDFLKQYEGPLYRGSDKFSGSDLKASEFFYHLGFTDDKRFHTGNEQRLAKRLEARARREGKELLPAQVLEESLKLNGGYVFDALLTCHNLLRSETNKVRAGKEILERIKKAEEKLAGPQTPSDRADTQKKLRQYKKDLAKLATVFPSLKIIRTKLDNEGAWYHLFGTLSAGYLYPRFGPASIHGETAFRWWFAKFKDPLERCWDGWGADLGGRISRLDVIKYRQPVSPGLGTNPSAIKTGHQGGKLGGSTP